MKDNIPKTIRKLIKVLSQEGHQAYLVGGCVRDFLLDKKPKDWDITTDAPLEELIKTLEKENLKIIPVGIEMGTLIVEIDREQYEITTFRRRKQPLSEDPLQEDLSLRDFSINAMAYHLDRGLIDPWDGAKDLQNKEIVTIGEGKEIFHNDPIRIIRGVRLSTELCFAIHPRTIEDMKVNKYLLKDESQERIQKEFNKMLLCDKPSRAIRLLVQLELLDFIIPELKKGIDFDQRNPHHDKDVFEHILTVLDNTPRDLIVRIAALLHDVGKPYTFTIDEEGVGHCYNHDKMGEKMAIEILYRLRYSNKIIKEVANLIREHMFHRQKITPKTARKFINKVGQENIDRLFHLKRADILGTKGPHNLEKFEQFRQMCESIIEESPALAIKDLKLNGNDLIEMGIPPGEEIGKILKYLLKKVIEDPGVNEKGKLREMVLKYCWKL